MSNIPRMPWKLKVRGDSGCFIISLWPKTYSPSPFRNPGRVPRVWHTIEERTNWNYCVNYSIFLMHNFCEVWKYGMKLLKGIFLCWPILFLNASWSFRMLVKMSSQLIKAHPNSYHFHIAPDSKWQTHTFRD